MSRSALQAVPQSSAPKPLSRQDLIDRYGELDRLCQLHAPIAREYESLKQQLKDWYDTFPAESTASEEGHQYKLIVSPREMQAQPDKLKLWKKFGKAGFLKLSVIFQKAVKDALANLGESADDDTVAQYFTRERTGSRKLTVVPKLGPRAA